MYKRILFFTLLFCAASISAAAEGEYIVRLRSGAAAPDNLEALTIDDDCFVIADYAQAKELLADGTGEYMEPDSAPVLFEPADGFSLPADELYPQQWNMQMINADIPWSLETYGNEIRVGVIDTGCYLHPELSDNIIPGKSYISGYDWYDDDKGHGTHVSGIIAAKADDIGVTGAAPKAKIVPLKCFTKNTNATYSKLAGAIVDAVDTYGCRVINMSWGTPSEVGILKTALEYAYNKGVICVAAVGNSYNSTIYYPAAFDCVIGVGSVTIDKKKSSFSQYNSSVFVTAPGDSVISTYNNGGYATSKGTSQATPAVSGIAALALSAYPELTPDEFMTLLGETAEDLGTAGYDEYFGYGLADAAALFDRLLLKTSYYISPVNISGDKAYVLIKNNTDGILYADSIFSGESVQASGITLLPGKSLISRSSFGGSRINHFLWNSTRNMKPLAKKRSLDISD